MKTYKAKIINTAEYLNTKYTDDQFVKVMNTEAINQIRIQQLKWQQKPQTNETNLMRTVTQIREAINAQKQDQVSPERKKMGKQSNTWPVY